MKSDLSVQNPDNRIYIFDEKHLDQSTTCHREMAASIEAIDKKIDALSQNLVNQASVVNSDPPRPTYALAAKRDSQFAKPQQLSTSEMRKAVIIGKVADPKQFSSSIELRDHIRQIKPDILQSISHGRLLANGNIMLVANSEDAIESLLSGWPQNSFGESATFRRMYFPNMNSEERTVYGPGASHDQQLKPHRLC